MREIVAIPTDTPSGTPSPTDDLTVSLIIPCRNEEDNISDCLESILANDFPKDRLEVLVIDGLSTDRTSEIVLRYTDKFASVRLVTNTRRIIPVAFNLGISESSSDIVMLMSAHSTYSPNYISSCVRSLAENDVWGTGGRVESTPSRPTFWGNSIAASLTHRFGVGNSHYKTLTPKAQIVDTAAFGCYRREVFEKVGPYNETLDRSSDMDFNQRLRAAGGQILLVPDAVAYYRSDPTIGSFLKHNFDDGKWAVAPLARAGAKLAFRHYIPLAFVLTILTSALAGIVWPWAGVFAAAMVVTYLTVCVLAGLQIAIRDRRPSFLVGVPIAFAVRHIPYGLGSLRAMLMFMPSWRSRR